MNDDEAQYLSYEPWGSVIINNKNEFDTIYKFTGQILDDSTNLYYYQARYYDPVLRRFITPDPIVQDPYDPQSLNRYVYCLNNPLKYIDPLGYEAEVYLEAVAPAPIVTYYSFQPQPPSQSLFGNFGRQLSLNWLGYHQSQYLQNQMQPMYMHYLSATQSMLNNLNLGMDTDSPWKTSLGMEEEDKGEIKDIHIG